MKSALLLFRQEYARDLAASLLTKLDWLDVKGIVGSTAELDSALEQHVVDVLLIGPTFIESVDVLMARRCASDRPLVVVLTRSDAASDKVRAAHHHVDKVVTMSRGLAPMLEELKACIVDPTTRRCSPADDFPLAAPHATAICVSDAADREIVRLVAAGFTDREIAEIVNYSHQTIRNRVSRILCDTGARNRTHLACMYLTLVHDGLIPFARA